MPIWVFHGAKDQVVPLSQSQDMVDALKEAGAEGVKFTVYPEANHDSWTETYANPELYEWFLSHQRNPSAVSKISAVLNSTDGCFESRKRPSGPRRFGRLGRFPDPERLVFSAVLARLFARL